MNKIIFPKDPYRGQIFWDMKTKIIFEYWIPDDDAPVEVKVVYFQNGCH